jgi:hypothetical protein
MLRLSTCLLLFSAAAFPAAGQALRTEPSAVDFGRRPENREFTARLTVTNPGAATVRVTGVDVDCGCLTAGLAAAELAPGKSAVLTIRIQSGGLDGDYEHHVLIATGPGAPVIVPVGISVYRYAHWSVVPSRVILRPVGSDAEPAADVRVAWLGSGPPPIAATTSNSPLIAVSTGAAGAAAVSLRVSRVRGAPAGAVYATITIRTRDPEAPVLEVPVFSYVTEDAGR